MGSGPAFGARSPATPSRPRGRQQPGFGRDAHRQPAKHDHWRTFLGSVANLIVVEQAGKEGVNIGFWDYCRIGIPVTSIALLIGAGWLALARY